MMNLKEHIPLAPYSNFKIGGEARYFFEAHTIEDLAEAAALARKIGVEIFILGGGTNLLISDRGFPGLVLVPACAQLEVRGDAMTAGAGVLMRELLVAAASHGLRGLEWAGGLPGTLGGAIRGNAGCFGGETKDAIREVKSFDAATGEIHTRPKTECVFGYRTSIWKTAARGEIVTETTLTLMLGDKTAIEKAIKEKIAYREARHPLEYPNIGSIFKNIPVDAIPEPIRAQCAQVIKNDPFPVVPTAYLISEARLKGLAVGGAMVSTKHPNFIVNTGRASAKDVSDLILKIKDAMYEKFSIAIEEEVERVGF